MTNSKLESVKRINESQLSFCLNVIGGEFKGVHGLTPETARLLHAFTSEYLALCANSPSADEMASTMELSDGEHHHNHGTTHSFFPIPCYNPSM